MMPPRPGGQRRWTTAWASREECLFPALLCLVAYCVGVLQATMWNIDHRAQVQVLRSEKAEAAQEYRKQSLVFRRQVNDEQLRCTRLSQQLRLLSKRDLDCPRFWWNFHQQAPTLHRGAATVLCHSEKA